MPTDKRQRQKQGRAERQAALQAHRRRAARRRQLISLVAIVALVFLAVALISRGGDGESNVTATGTTTTTAATPVTLPPAKGDSSVCPAPDGSSPRATQFSAPPKMCIDPAKKYTAVFETDKGPFTVALDAAKAPQTVNNFVFLARYHFFDSSLFHRVITGFVIQGGDANKGDGTGDAGYKIPDELPKQGEYKIGSIAMANSGAANSGGSQFFVIVGDQGLTLPPSYTLFGQVTEGIEVAQAIEQDGGIGSDGKPKVVHQIKTVTITEA
jgi:cyclophilin family peptidyl-prolyl cis-trans isomerase